MRALSVTLLAMRAWPYMRSPTGDNRWLDQIDAEKLSARSLATLEQIERPIARTALWRYEPGAIGCALGFTRHQVRHRRERLRREYERQQHLGPHKARKCIWCRQSLHPNQRRDALFCRTSHTGSRCRTAFLRARRHALKTGTASRELIVAVSRHTDSHAIAAALGEADVGPFDQLKAA